MTGRKITYILISIILTVIFARTAFALENPKDFTKPTIPTFPLCKKPQGVVKVTYKEGKHGIAGESKLYNGSDTVYHLSEETLTQCFCADNGKGIQTDWWKVSSLSFDQIEYLKTLGWIYIPNGADWGLEDSEYMAKNSKLSCSKNNSSRDDDDDDDKDNRRGGVVLASVLGRGGQILGLASTGNTLNILVSFLSGVTFLSAAYYFLKSKNDK